MSGKLFLRGKNEETLLLRVLQVLAKQGVNVLALNMKAQADELELEILLTAVNGVTQTAKILEKQIAVFSVNTMMVQEQAAV